MTRTATLLCALVLLGCRSGPGAADSLVPRTAQSASVLVEIVDTLDPVGPYVGLTISFTTRPQLVQIERGMGADRQRRVVTHELLHAAGLEDHPWDDESCFAYPLARSWCPSALCPQEAAWVRTLTRTFRIVRVAPELRADVVWALGAINAAAGRFVFVLNAPLPAPKPHPREPRPDKTLVGRPPPCPGGL